MHYFDQSKNGQKFEYQPPRNEHPLPAARLAGQEVAIASGERAKEDKPGPALIRKNLPQEERADASLNKHYIGSTKSVTRYNGEGAQTGDKVPLESNKESELEGEGLNTIIIIVVVVDCPGVSARVIMSDR